MRGMYREDDGRYDVASRKNAVSPEQRKNWGILREDGAENLYVVSV